MRGKQVPPTFSGIVFFELFSREMGPRNPTEVLKMILAFAQVGSCAGVGIGMGWGVGGKYKAKKVG